jgi:hypothetical protein
MISPKKFGDVQTLTNSTQNKDYFSTKYSLKTKAGGNDGLVIGQEIYCLPLVQNGVYEMVCHAVKPRGQQGFKSKFTTYIQCKGYNYETGDYDSSCICCQLAQEEWDKYVANGKKGETMISFKSSRFYIPVLLLGNDTGSKTSSSVPVSKLTMSGRDFSFVEFSQRGFNDLIALFKNDLLNNGRMDYGLEGAELMNEIMKQMQKHILKISINKPDGFGTHKKVFSFISFDNKNIGAETGSYKNITEGLAKSAKLKAEAEEFLTLFGNECEGMLTHWTDIELANYVHGITTNTEAENKVVSTGVAPKAQTTPVPKAEQVVIEDTTSDDADEDLFDGEDDLSDLSLDNSSKTPVAVGSSSDDINIDEDDFSMGEDEDFFGEE